MGRPRTYTFDMMDSFVSLTASFPRLEREFNRRKAELLSKALGFEVQQCSDCFQPMIPKRMWDMLDRDDRPPGIALTGAHGYCQRDYRRRFVYRPKVAS